MTNRIDVMLDIETLGTEDNHAVIQLAAAAFDIHTGKVFSKFNEYITILEDADMVISGQTLLWWMQNKELLHDILLRGKKSEKIVLEEFSAWVKGLSDNMEDVYIWSNGMLFDNKIIQAKMKKHGIRYPIGFRNDRDMRTIVDIAAKRMNISDKEFLEYVSSNSKKEYIKHDACQDVESQIEVVTCAWNILIYDTM